MNKGIEDFIQKRKELDCYGRSLRGAGIVVSPSSILRNPFQIGDVVRRPGVQAEEAWDQIEFLESAKSKILELERLNNEVDSLDAKEDYAFIKLQYKAFGKNDARENWRSFLHGDQKLRKEFKEARDDIIQRARYQMNEYEQRLLRPAREQLQRQEDTLYLEMANVHLDNLIAFINEYLNTHECSTMVNPDKLTTEQISVLLEHATMIHGYTTDEISV